MTTNLCETLVCGKDNESMFMINCPMGFVSSYFSDLFRSLIARNVSTMYMVAIVVSHIFYLTTELTVISGVYNGDIQVSIYSKIVCFV